MRVLVAGFITIDVIELKNVSRVLTSIGGPPCYAGLACARHGLKVDVVTKVGNDFPDDQVTWLTRNGITINYKHRSSQSKTTRFHIAVHGERRELTLIFRCKEPSKDQIENQSYDASIISPVAGEISKEMTSLISKLSSFVFLDPQGFVRSFDKNGKVKMKNLEDREVLTYATAIKADTDEAMCITGKSNVMDALSYLHGKGIKKAVVTNGSEPCHVLDGDRVYRVDVPKVRIVDTTGAGDMLSGTITTFYLKTRDFLWSACFGVASSSITLNMLALNKLDIPIGVEEVARKLYSNALYVGAV